MILRKKFISQEDTDDFNEYQKEDKFNLIKCHLEKNYCHNILKEVNRLYAESELARINNEYLRSVDFLQEAYYKTKELKESSCVKCVNLFQSNINQTIEIMKDELNEISHGFFSKKNYQLAYSRLCDLEKQVNQV